MSDVVEMEQPLGLFAGDLFKRATEFLNALDILSKDEEVPEFPAYFLFAHSIELLLKSHLAANGISKRSIKRDYWHDLPKLFRECEARSLPHVPMLDAYVAHTHEMNKDHDFRYPSVYRIAMPRLNDCISIGRALANELHPLISRTHLDAELKFAAETRHLRGKKIRWSE